jgi:hypothetical protein
MKGTKEIVLTRRYWDEIELDCADMVWAVFGTAVHKVFEGHEGEQEIAEDRITLPINTPFGQVNISGGFDLYNADEQMLTDYKTSGVFGYRMKIKEGYESEWAKQLRVYWLLLGLSGFPVKKAKNVILLKDWSKTVAKRDASYPQTPVVVINYGYGEVMNSEVAAYLQADISEKLTEIIASKDMPEDQIPTCSKENRWERDECWAVMKEGRKSAVKRCQSEFEALRLVKELGIKHYVQHRPGTPVKCIDYCACKGFCSFYKAYMASLEQEESQEAMNG